MVKAEKLTGNYHLCSKEGEIRSRGRVGKDISIPQLHVKRPPMSSISYVENGVLAVYERQLNGPVTELTPLYEI